MRGARRRDLAADVGARASGDRDRRRCSLARSDVLARAVIHSGRHALYSDVDVRSAPPGSAILERVITPPGVTMLPGQARSNPAAARGGDYKYSSPKNVCIRFPHTRGEAPIWSRLANVDRCRSLGRNAGARVNDLMPVIPSVHPKAPQTASRSVSGDLGDRDPRVRASKNRQAAARRSIGGISVRPLPARWLWPLLPLGAAPGAPRAQTTSCSHSATRADC